MVFTYGHLFGSINQNIIYMDNLAVTERQHGILKHIHTHTHTSTADMAED